MQNDTWSEYHKIKSTKPPSKLLVRALDHVKNKNGKALDLGAGALVDSNFLLEQGFEVTAVDSSQSSKKIAEEIHNPKFTFVQSAYDTFAFQPETYDLITAQWALPFNSPNTFLIMFENLKSSLKVGGIFVGQFFGVLDEWNTPDRDMTFNTYEEVQELLSRLYVIELNEEEKDGTTARGDAKHWHVFHVIAERD